MFPRASCPRAGQSGLWQNWASGSIGVPPEARFGNPARRDARWTRVFQATIICTTVPWRRYLHSKNRFTGNYLGPICCVGLRKAPGGVLSAGPGQQGIGDGNGLGSTGTTDTDAGRYHCGETRPPKELRRQSLCRYRWPLGVVDYSRPRWLKLCLYYRLVYREVSCSTNERTGIFTVLA